MAKNFFLNKKTGEQIRGKNKEAVNAIIFFAVFIAIAILLSLSKTEIGKMELINEFHAIFAGTILIVINLFISAASLISLKDSWRVGVVENQKTALVTQGIYRFTRNPYFVSYLLMFAAYTVLLQNLILLFLSIFGFLMVHKMVLSEEQYLYAEHGNDYKDYIEKVPRYLII